MKVVTMIMDIINKDLEYLEKRFLAYLFNNKKYIAMSIGKVKKEFMPKYGKIYTLLVVYYTKYKDIISDITIDTQFKKKNLDKDVVIEYKSMISSVKEQTGFSDGEFKSLMDELQEQFQRRECIKIAEQIINTNPNSCNTDEFNKMKKKIKETLVSATSNADDVKKEGTIKDLAKSRLEYYRKIKANPEMLNFIPSGFKHFDEVNGGFKPGELIYVIGRKGDGKSICLLNMAYAMWREGYNVIIFSLEIPRDDYMRRFDALAAQVSSNGLKRGMMSPEEEKRYEQYLSNLEKGLTPDGKKCGQLYIVDSAPGITTAFIEGKVEQIEQVLGIKFDCIISDYSGIMKDNIGATEKRHIYSNIALDLKTLAREHDCVVISAAQKNRNGAKEKSVGTENVAESDGVSDHLDIGIDIMSTSEEYGKIETFKTRDGEQVKFSFRKQYSSFKILPLENSVDAWDQLS